MKKITWTVAALAIMLAGCSAQRMGGQQLERVAKDWSLGIRASQVIPVYPLTEDVQPGDVFLVQTPVEEQAKVYLDRGFLPLENLITRLPLEGYGAFYADWPDVGEQSPQPPRRWQFPSDGVTNFSRAPLAAFPTYNFSVTRSGGLSAAIPVQSLPIGMNLLDSASANGTITMKDAFTYALPAQTIFQKLEAWAQDNRGYLRQFEPRERQVGGKVVPQPFYLRVVNRVYLVKTVDVSLFSNRAAGATATAGAPRKVELLDIANPTEAKKQFDVINEMLAGSAAPGAALPGGSVRLAMASARAVSLVETFPRPLVIGYLAFDYEILPGGKLNAPVSTFLTLEGHKPVAGKPIVPFEGCDADCDAIERWLDAEDANFDRLKRWLGRRGINLEPYQVQFGPYSELRALIVKELMAGN
ncbi:MAG: hypothetical protein IT532_14900 [Burkholderiales bacterium]|nr:hypothetical protein [Burkholderiales bacterium]